MKLRDILYGVEVVSVHGTTEKDVAELAFDSRKVVKGTAFFAIKGTLSDGHAFIESAVKLGADIVICENLPGQLDSKVIYIEVKDTGVALGIMASNFYEDPSSKIKLVGITGTNGKTTIATLLFKLFMSLGYKVGLISTVENQINNAIIPATHTTPDPLSLNLLLTDMINAGCEYCFMEVSSHAVVQHRIAGLTFTGG
ncbi:MAG: UDP-N-acetylmuramoyl-L-alanyl-D-glutamate--2,6-diaminopimelate ligase, partial [Pedobacter sp.]